MKLRIWHNSNLGNPHFESNVPDVETAKQWLQLLADYDLYQGERVVANAQGLMVYNEKAGEWDEWEREEDGACITTVIDEEKEKAFQNAANTVATKMTRVTKGRSRLVAAVKVSREELSRRKARQ